MHNTVAIAFLLVGCSAVVPPAFAASQVACSIVISELNQVSKTEDKRILAMEKVAKRLETSPLWIENCMRIYGRSVPRRVNIDLELREQLLERMEETELGPEDLAPEDIAEPDPFSEEAESAGTEKRKPNEHIRRQP